MKVVAGRCRECRTDFLVHVHPCGDRGVTGRIPTSMADIEMVVAATKTGAAEEIWQTNFCAGLTFAKKREL